MPGFADWRLNDHDGCIRVDGDRVAWHRADRTAVRYLGKQIEVSGGFLHGFVVCLLGGEVEDQLNRGFIRLWEIRNDWENRAWVYARKEGGGWTIHFEQLHDGVNTFAFHGSSQLGFGTRYAVKVSRDGGNYRLTLQDGAGLIVEDSGDIEGVLQGYEIVWLASTIKSRRNNHNWSSGYIENLTIA